MSRKHDVADKIISNAWFCSRDVVRDITRTVGPMLNINKSNLKCRLDKTTLTLKRIDLSRKTWFICFVGENVNDFHLRLKRFYRTWNSFGLLILDICLVCFGTYLYPTSFYTVHFVENSNSLSSHHLVVDNPSREGPIKVLLKPHFLCYAEEHLLTFLRAIQSKSTPSNGISKLNREYQRDLKACIWLPPSRYVSRTYT
jgi:hypothetical protein